MNKWYLYNVVFYDGVDAYVSKFVASSDEKDAHKHISSYAAGNGEILKLDKLYPLTFDEIMGMKNIKSEDEIPGDAEKRCAVERWIEMYF